MTILSVTRGGVSGPFVDPKLSAIDAPVCWLPKTGAAILSATAVRARVSGYADLALPELSCLRHIVERGRGGGQRLLLHTTDGSIALDLHGDRITDAAVNVTFHVSGLVAAPRAGALLGKLPRLVARVPREVNWGVYCLFLRDGLIALDGSRVGATYLDIAEVIFGRARAAAAWAGPSRSMKDRLARARGKAETLVEGKYRHLIA